MIKYSDISKYASRFVEAKYALCDTANGYDCLSMILEFYRSLGVVFPSEFKGFTEDNYGEKWEAGEGVKEYHEFISSIGRKIEINYMIASDLLIFNFGEKCLVTVGIYLGNGNALMCFDKGIRVVPLKFFKTKVTEVRRWLV